jgi:hypothetical protein
VGCKSVEGSFSAAGCSRRECHCVAIQSCLYAMNNCTIIAVKCSCVCEVNLSFLLFLLLYSQSVRLSLTLKSSV